MMRTKIVAVVGAAALVLLSACSSASDTPKADESSPGPITSAQGGTDSSTANSPDPSGSEATDSADTEADAPGVSSGSDADPGTASTGPSAAEGTGTLDGQSAAWFSTACTGLKPTLDAAVAVLSAGMAGMGGTSGSASPSQDPAALQAAVVAAMKKASDSLDGVADDLSALPPPTIPNGKKLAQEAIGALHQAGPKFAKFADELSSTTVTDTASLQQALKQLGQEMNDVEGLDSSLLDAVTNGDGNDEVSAATAKAITALPACAALDPFAAMEAGGAPATTN